MDWKGNYSIFKHLSHILLTKSSLRFNRSTNIFYFTRFSLTLNLSQKRCFIIFKDIFNLKGIKEIIDLNVISVHSALFNQIKNVSFQNRIVLQRHFLDTHFYLNHFNCSQLPFFHPPPINLLLLLHKRFSDHHQPPCFFNCFFL